ncbi:unnamed protein product [Lathyrus sativus]|nr:unnamed protein product [Lathyrus sativus]
MEDPEKGLSTCGISETTLSHDEIVGGETLDGGQVQSCNGQGGEDLKSVEVGGGNEARLDDSRVVESEEGRSENAAGELGSLVSERAASGETVVDGDSCTVVNTASGDFTVKDAVGAADHKVTSTSCDIGLGCSFRSDSQKDWNLIDHGTREDGNDLTLETLDEQKNIHLKSGEKIVDQRGLACDKVEIEGKLSSNGEQPIGNDEVNDNSNNVQEVVCGTKAEIDETLLNSDEKHSSILKKCNTKEKIVAENDVGSVSDAEQSDACKEMQVDVDDLQGTETSKTMNHTVDIKGTPVSLGSEKNLDANAIVEKDTQITDQGSHMTLRGRKEKIDIELNTRQNVEERESVSDQVGSNGKNVKHALVKPGSSEIVHQAQYSLPIEKQEGEFSLSDMVWGKVRSHPWWPGQIFDPSDASERAMKYYKKDCYFVAYFGDRTFAWNEASQLKHFRAHFSTIEKQRSSSESFQNAIGCALDEVSRRVEYGLACSCTPKDTYEMIKSQAVENTGIRREISFKHVIDESLNANSFSPTKLIEYVKTLSELPTGGFDRLELVTAKAQLLAFNRFKGFSCLAEIQHCGVANKDNSFVDDEQDLCEVNEHTTPAFNKDDQAGPGNFKNPSSTRQKRKYNFKNAMHPTKKERKMSDLMNGTPDSSDDDSWTPDSVVSPEPSKKRRSVVPNADDSEMQDGTKAISVGKGSNTTKSSFNIGDCIRRAASQLTASSSILKCSSDQSPKTDGDIDGFPENETVEDDQITSEYSSLNDLLSSLQWVAQEPLAEYTFLNGIVSFFSDFRNSVTVAADWKEILRMDKIGGFKRKRPPIAGTGSPETFEFEDMSDTYWTDRVVDNGNEEKLVQQPSQKNQKKDEQPVTAKSPKPAAAKSPKPAQVRRPYNKKKVTDINHAETTTEKPPGYIDENAPAELVMNFAEFNSVPSETNLNKMFKRFGPLKESETEVDRVTSRARVVFKKCVDAEVAFSSAKKFNIFGSVLVNYQLNYAPSALFKASSVDATQDQEMLLDLSSFDVNMV